MFINRINSINWQTIHKNIIILSLAFMLVIAQLNSVHYDPIRTYWGEITCAIAMLVLFIYTGFITKKITIPYISLGVLMFLILILLQAVFLKINFVGILINMSLELLLCIMLMLAIATLQSIYTPKTLVKYIAILLLIGGILQALIGMIQYCNLFKYFNDIIFYDAKHPNTNIFGHFGQRNNYCHYLSWSIFALIYLYVEDTINNTQTNFKDFKINLTNHKFSTYKTIIFIVVLLFLVFSATISSSRSVFIYFIMASIVSLSLTIRAFFVQKNLVLNNQQQFTHMVYIKYHAYKKYCFYTIVTLVLLLIFGSFIPLIQNHFGMDHHKLHSGLERLVSDNTTGRRLFEWQKAWMIFLNNPIFGLGISTFPKQSVYLSYLFPNQPNNGGALFVYCHNTLLQILADTGLVGAMIILCTIIYAIYILFYNNSLENIFLLSLICTTISHSMLEYPLWYLYFLAPFMLFLSLTNKNIVIYNNKIIKFFMLLITVCFLSIIINVSNKISNLTLYWDVPQDSKQFIQQEKYIENIVNNDILLSSYAIHAIDDYIVVNDINTNQALSPEMQLYYEVKFINTYPYPTCLLKVAMLYWQLNNQQQAINTMHIFMRAYPYYRLWALKQLHNKQYIKLYKFIRDY